METYEAVDWINDRTGPWLATVAFHAPHDPYDIINSNGVDTTSEDCFDALNRKTSDTKKYAGIVSCLDTYLGELLLELDSTGQLSNTLLIVVGDNGTDEGVSEDKWNIDGDNIADGKGTVYENGVRVPLIVVDGANIAFDGDAVSGTVGETTALIVDPGRTIDHLLHTVDLFATIADVVGAIPDPTTFLDSVSFAETLTNVSATPARDSVYTERFLTEDGATEGQAATRFIQIDDDEATGISAGDYKLIFDVKTASSNAQTCTYTLFDLDWNRFENFASSGSDDPRLGALEGDSLYAYELKKAIAAVPSGVTWFDPKECTAAIQAPGS
jgi:arylsulfatase A-like enzyme